MSSVHRGDFGETEFNLLKLMDNIEIIDSHEHTPPEEARTSLDVDIFTLFSHYTHRDLLRAGMTEEKFQDLSDLNIPIEKRWSDFSPYWENIRHTCYSRAVLIAVKKFYEIEDINEKTYRRISEKMAELNKPGIYKKVFKDACNIRTCLCQCGRTDLDPDIFTPVMPLKAGVEDLETSSAKTIDEYLASIEKYIIDVKREGAVGLKTHSRLYPEPDRKEALSEFHRMKNGKNFSVPVIESYISDETIRIVGKQGMTIAVHAGYWGDFRELHPLHIIPVLQRHPDVRFDVYHLGYPWVRDTLMLGKGFSNVWLNFCWTYIISQKCATEALDEALDLIPANKIIGFGGDYKIPVEKVYGHLIMAKESIARVLGKRISEGSLTESQALSLVQKWFWDNPIELYNLII